MRSPVTAVIVTATALLAGFVAGRGTAPVTTDGAPSTTPPRAQSAAPQDERGPVATAASPSGAAPPGTSVRRPADDGPPPTGPASVTTTTTTSPGAVAGAGGATPPASCEVLLEEARAELVGHVKRREDLEGKALPARTDVAPRFGSGGLLGTFQRGFQQSGVKGSVESVDCSEHPCILFGRLEGDEAEVAKLEDSAVFAAYDDDVGVMLTWASGHGGAEDDDGQKGAAPAGGAREKPEEVSLFAFAFYGTDEVGQSEAIDRRIRVRTAEYWNASRPRE